MAPFIYISVKTRIQGFKMDMLRSLLYAPFRDRCSFRDMQCVIHWPAYSPHIYLKISGAALSSSSVCLSTKNAVLYLFKTNPQVKQSVVSV